MNALSLQGKYVEQLVGGYVGFLRLELTNIVCGDGGDVDADRLNVRCGSDFVQKGQRAPYVYNGRAERTTGGRTRGLSLGCSLDGDSDRIVFYAHGGDGNVDRDGGMPFTLLDGDKISSLLASFVRQELSALSSPPCRPLSVAVVQTAYANDASAAYLRSLDVTTKCTATGVMHLHHAASKYDVGIYFESNGHGTVLFSQMAREGAGGAGLPPRCFVRPSLVPPTVA
mmetsp:Transcript_44592/g.87436  ORF Transcript_44592/g.87436 Transcript_44592/m.87436 type:complete len:227 (-) Transcript_44592:210-890(-)